MSSYLYLISRALNYYLKEYGLKKTLKGILYYHINALNYLRLPFLKKSVLQINGHPLSIIPGDKGIPAQLIFYGTHEPLATLAIKKFITKGMVCMDVGSNIGYYACLESNIVGENGKVFSIEPSPLNFNFLKKNIELQKMQNFKIFNFGCGDKDGTIPFLVSNRSNWSRVADETDDHLINDNTKKIIVPLKKIDTFVEEEKIQKLDFIRMDVEGYEYNVFFGMKKTLELLSPKLQIEIHHVFLGKDKTKEILTNFQNLGYDVEFFIPQDMDLPFIGESSDIKQYSISKLLELLNSNSLPKIFQLFLKK